MAAYVAPRGPALERERDLAGRTFEWSDIERIRITVSDQPSEQLLARVRAENPGSQTVYLGGMTYAVSSARDFTDELITDVPGASASEGEEEADGPGNLAQVLVVHGRDEEARLAMFDFLRALGLQPLEWSQAVAATGKAAPYVGEVLDVAFGAGAVVALFTLDDEARLRHVFVSEHDPAHERDLTGQARPNVLFEAGMALERHPDRTVLVELGQLAHSATSSAGT